MPTHNLVQNPELIRRITNGLGLRQAHVTPAVNEGIQVVVIADDLRGGSVPSALDSSRFSCGTEQTRAGEDGHTAATQLRNPIDSKVIARVRSLRLQSNAMGSQSTAFDEAQFADVKSSYVNSGTLAAPGLTGIGRGLLDDPGVGGVANFSRRGFAFLTAIGRRGNSACFVDMGGVTNADINVEPLPFTWYMTAENFVVTNPGPDVAGVTTALFEAVAPYHLEINWGISNGVAQGPVLQPGDTFAVWIPIEGQFCRLLANWEWQEFGTVVGG